MTDFSPKAFGASWQKFLDYMAAQARPSEPSAPLLVDRLQAFMAAELTSLVILRERFLERDLPNLQMALDHYLTGPDRFAEQVGYLLEHDQPGLGLSNLLTRHRWQGIAEGPVQYRAVELAGGERLQCVERGLYLMVEGGHRLVVSVRISDYYEQGPSLEVLCLERERGEAFVAELHALMRAHDVYRGQVISLGAKGAEDVRFHHLPHIERNDIILPERLLASLERATLGFDVQAERLHAAGRHLKRGLLFHGPPGTGKTLSLLYLLSQMQSAARPRTAILLTGRVMGLITQSCRLARLLAPSVVVLEDVDLVAMDRSLNEDTGPLLFELLNEMDGLADDVDVLFILSTNRPDRLEPALTARPGRIDQALEFPLPDADGRRRLLARYGQGLNLRSADLDDMVLRTAGASPAFIRELLRKAALLAATETPTSAELPALTSAHLRDALRAIVEEGGDLTQRLLGAGALSDPQAE
jgi:hypothetical protein